MKKFISILIIIILLFIGGCTTTPKPEPTPPPAPGKLHMKIGLQVWSWYLKYNIAKKEATDDERCYKGMKVTKLPDKPNNIWYRAGLREGDFIVMVENRDGFMATLTCHNSDDAIAGWFPGKAREQLCTNPMEVWLGTQECNPDPEGFYIERLRWQDGGKFTLETLIVRFE